MIKTFQYLVFLCSVMLSGQSTIKKNVTPEDYGLWHSLTYLKFSSNGKWVSYQLNYEGNNDTLFVKNTDSDITYNFPRGNQERFIYDGSYLLSELPDHRLSLLDLSSGQTNQYGDVISYKISNSGEYIGILQNKGGNSYLRIINFSSGVENNFGNVTEFAFRPFRQELTYVEKDKDLSNLHIINLNKKGDGKIIASSRNTLFKFLEWDGSGKALVFFKGNEEGKFVAESLNYYCKGKVFTLDKSIKGFMGYQILPSNPRIRVFFSADAKKVFFGIRDIKRGTEKLSGDEFVQVWHYLDEFVYPKKNNVGDWGRLPLLSMWEPQKKKFSSIGSRANPNAVITQDGKYALLFHPMGNRVQHKQHPNVDYTLMDLNTGKQTKILEKQQNKSNLTQVSSKGRYISYYRKKHWWVYDIKKGKHTNVTQNLKVDFYNDDSYSKVDPFGSPGWDMNDNFLIVYDRFDIWLIKPDGSSAIKITDGRAEKKKFRLYDNYLTWRSAKLFEGYQATQYDLDSGLLMTIKGDDAQSGFARWDRKFGVRDLIYGPERNSTLKSAKNKNCYIYMTQRFDSSSKLVFLKQGNTPKTIYRSNRQQESFSWGKAELVEYVTSKGDSLQGVLYYPANYQRGKKYPMVVNIYQKLSGNLHDYENPGYYNYIGFNKTNFTLRGYFVLEPDIKYEISNPGMSAVDAVESATLKVLSLGDVDTKKIGLIGHSFGAYEAAFIASQSNLFATVVAGEGIHNLISWYLTLNKDTARPEMWRFETDQMRMGKPYYENMYAYLKNSTIHQVKGINTPILLWAGKEDGNVDWRQSLELYLALRRRDIASVLLAYPKERHSILDHKNQKDLTIRIEQWMDYHLKGNPPADWIIKGDPKFQYD